MPSRELPGCLPFKGLPVLPELSSLRQQAVWSLEPHFQFVDLLALLGKAQETTGGPTLGNNARFEHIRLIDDSIFVAREWHIRQEERRPRFVIEPQQGDSSGFLQLDLSLCAQNHHRNRVQCV